MIDNAFRRLLPQFAGPLIRAYRALGLTPNAVTTIGFALACVCGLLIAADRPILALSVWWISRLADGTDGILARESGLASDFGAYFDIVLDMAGYGVVVIALDLRHPEYHMQWMLMLWLYILCITSALALGMEEAKRGEPPRDDRGLRLGAGLAEGGETGIAYTIFLLVPGWLWLSTWLWIAVLATTVVARTLIAHRNLRG